MYNSIIIPFAGIGRP